MLHRKLISSHCSHSPHRHNFFPIFFILVCWSLLAILVVFVDPTMLAQIGLAPFWVLLWLASFYTISLVFRHAKRGLLYATALTLYAVFRYLGVGHPIVGLFLLGIAIAVQYYLEHG